MFIYLINLFFVTCFLRFSKLNDKKKFFCVLIWFFLLGAFRAEGIGYDYYNYQDAFNYFSRGIYFGYERGYVLLNLFCLKLGNYRMLVSMVSLISMIGPIYYMREKSKVPWLSMWLFITIGFHFWTFTIYRQAIAITFALFAYIMAEKKKVIPFIILSLLAISFHTVSVIILIIYPLFNFEKIKKYLAVLFSMFVLFILIFRDKLSRIILFVLKVAGNRFNYYEVSESNTGQGQTLAIVYVCIFIFIVILLIGMKWEERKKYTDLMTFSFLAVCCQLVSFVFPLMNRLGLFFAVPMFILLPNIIQTRFSAKSKLICYLLIMFVSLVFYILVYSGDEYLTPYRLIRPLLSA